MKLIILSPNLHLIFSLDQRKYLESIFDIEYYTTPQKIQDINSLSTKEPKIVAIDPDFCDWSVTHEDIDFMQDVQAICLQTTGFHYIDIDYLRTKWIPVTNLRGFSTNAVAEQAMSIAFSLARRLPLVIRDGWKTDFDAYRGIELSGKKAGIIGLGRIGTRIAEMTQAFGMETLYWSRSTRDERFAYLELEDLIRESDVIFYTLAKNDETLYILAPDLLANLKKTVLFISIAHIDHALFVSLAEEWKIWGFGCDDPLDNKENLKWNIMPWASLGWCTDECFKRNGEQWIEAMEYALKWEYPNQVN